MEELRKAGRIDDLIKFIADDLIKCGNGELCFEGYKFRFQEMDYPNPMDFTSFTMIDVIIPPCIKKEIGVGLSVAYESTYGKDSKTTYMNRIKACLRLSEGFVYKVLPKVSYWVAKEINNKEVEEILKVLE